MAHNPQIKTNSEAHPLNYSINLNQAKNEHTSPDLNMFVFQEKGSEENFEFTKFLQGVSFFCTNFYRVCQAFCLPFFPTQAM